MASGSRSLGGTCIIANLPDELPCTVGDRAGDVSGRRRSSGRRCGRRGLHLRRDRDARAVQRVRGGHVVRLPVGRGRRHQRGRSGRRHRRLGAVLCRSAGGAARPVRSNFRRRHRRRAAGVEQRHRHLEGAEHDHDHADADQQRADPRASCWKAWCRRAARSSRRPWSCRRPCPWRPWQRPWPPSHWRERRPQPARRGARRR